VTPVALIGLIGAGGEPVDLRRTLGSHGVAELPPMYVDEDGLGATVTLATPEGPRSIRLSEATLAGVPAVAVDAVDAGPRPGEAAAAALAAAVRRMLCLEDDLSGFYAQAAADAELAWAARGAGRLLRSPTVFEDVIKTVCTTNCAWSATVRMTGALVGRLGEPAPGAPPGDVAGRAFPTPEAMASAGDAFYADVARAGYRGAYLRAIAGQVAGGELDLEELLAASRAELPDDEVERRLLALPASGRTRRPTSCSSWAATPGWCSTRGRGPSTRASWASRRAASSPTARSPGAFAATASTPGWPSGWC